MQGLLVAMVSCVLLELVVGHGRMIEPAARNVMWRYGYKTPRNYNDMGLNCGGFPNQFEVNHGKCGVCGDPYQGPRDHEAGGKYAFGVVARRYPINAMVNVTIELTSNHMGYFEFRLCPVNDPRKRASEACLNRHVLNIIGHGTKYFITRREMSVTMDMMVMLPPRMKCKQCVLQWKWVAGNSVSSDGKGGECMGCGNQENFVNCADIAIGNEVVTPLPIPVNTKTSVKPETRQPYSKQRPTYTVPGLTPTTQGYPSTRQSSHHQSRHTHTHTQHSSTSSSSSGPTTLSWYHDPNLQFNNAHKDAGYRTQAAGSTPTTQSQSWNEYNGYNNKDWYPGATNSWKQDPNTLMQMFPNLMENWEQPEQQSPSEQQQQQQNNGESGSGLEPGEYPETPETTAKPYSAPNPNPSNQAAGADSSYMRGYQDALRQLQAQLGYTVNGNQQKIAGLNRITSAVGEMQKAAASTPVGTPSSKCPDGVSSPSCRGINSWEGNPEFDSWCLQTCTTGECPANFCSCNCPGVSSWTRGTVCRSVDRKQSQTLDPWCQVNCKQGNCPSNLCTCE